MGMRLRGEICISAASVLSAVALVLLIFMHVGQINTSTVPRNIEMIQVNMTSFAQGVAAAISPDPVDGLFTDNASAPLQQRQGVRNIYKFGLYSYCAYVNGSAGLCSNSSAGFRFEPFDLITADMQANYSGIATGIIVNTTFNDSHYLGQFSNGAYYVLLIGTICTALALITGILKHTFGFLVSTLFAIAGSLMLLIGATIWTVVIKKAQTVNDIFVGPQASPVPLGIEVTIGNALYLAWAGFGCLVASTIPYMISCCTYRG
ncbi:hypothetical protein K474DRAFT_1658247 [Panus rudis PR-1116 ss-1]|nr:hypothetical protein K474DRAFT_1658247 [Panus rudis PR-1116 ss-1]